MLRIKETARDVALFALVGTLFYTFKAGVLVYKIKKKLSKPEHICLYCNEIIPRGGGVHLGDGEGICMDCARKGVTLKEV